MRFSVMVHPRATADVRRQTRHLTQHASLEFAIAWAAQVDAAVASLGRMPERCGLAFEAEDLGLPLRQLLAGDRSQVYRVLFVVRERRVHVVRVRHCAQAPLTRRDFTLPRGDHP